MEGSHSSAPVPESFASPPARESPLLERVGFLLAKTHVRMRERANAMLAPLHLDVMQYGSLTVLEEVGALSQQGLAEMIGCDRTTMVAIVDRLEGSGYVERQRNPQDRRAYALRITDAGAAASRQARGMVDSIEAEFLEPLSGDERRQLTQMLRRLLVR